jgi:hypothetical protein
MAITALNLPTDIPWERVCVTTDMVDPGGQPSQVPPLWQSSMALYRFVPPDEYQVYPGRRIVYYKLAVTITNYQPKADQILGIVNSAGLSTGTIKDEDVKRRLNESLPCTAAIVQVTVTPKEANRALENYPYFLDVQPRQRALYEQVTETQERASRSLETLQIRKDGGSSNSLEVLDIDQGGSMQAQIAGFGGGLSRSGQWGPRSLGKEDTASITTNDASREARETLAFTTQISQMYTLLQAYHLGTNRVVFYITPRPHAVEPPTGLAGPRKLDGVQDLFLVVNQDEDDELPCITARLDTGHLAVRPVFDFDRSRPPQILRLDLKADPPIEGDPTATAANFGGSTFYGCYFKSESKEVSLTAPDGYLVDQITELTNFASGNSNFIHGSTVRRLPDALQTRQVVISGTATGFACFRNTGGDFFNQLFHPSQGVTDTPIWKDTWESLPGTVIRSVSVSFRSELRTVKRGDEYWLVLTTRQLQCCDAVSFIPPKMIAFIPVWIFGIPRLEVPTATEPELPVPDPPRPPEATTAVMATHASRPSAPQAPLTGMTLDQVNRLQQHLVEETERLSRQMSDVANAPSRDDEFVLHSVLREVQTDTRRARGLRSSATVLGLSDKAMQNLARNLGRYDDNLSRFDVMTAPDELLNSATQMSTSDLMRLRLEAAGLPTLKAAADDKQPKTVKTPRSNRRKNRARRS